MTSRKKLEALLKILQKLAKSNQIPILVEGRKDRYSLQRLGIDGRIICLKNSGNVLSDILDQIRSKEVILLVDFDDYGTTLAHDITQYLERNRIKVNSVFWKKLNALVRRDVKDIEGLSAYLEKLKKSVNTK